MKRLTENFNPRPPCGGRLISVDGLNPCTLISTHALLAEGDVSRIVFNVSPPISTHALLAEGDGVSLLRGLLLLISTHALLAEGDIYASKLGDPTN